LSLPTGFAQWYLQSVLGFRQLMIIRLLHLGLFSIFLLSNFYLKYGFDTIMACYFITYSLSGIYSIFSGLSKVHYIRHYDLISIKKLFSFGKYSMATMLGSTLLRNSDVFIIDSMLGTSFVAIYSVPIKIFDVVETFTRSFIYTAMPKVAWFQNHGRTQELKYYLYEKVGILTLLFVPITLGLMVFAHPLVYVFGGEGYVESESVLKILAIYMVLIPMDRYTGLCLDLFHLPHLNFLKVVLMLVINIVTDIIAIHLTGDCNGVAFTTTITSMCGTLLGVYFLRNHIKFPIPKMTEVVWVFLKQSLKSKRFF
ncbi:MAG: oligosaccharide flippase family protein, partial [Cytophagales bacterium]|nr:oligosaccharide flippase family protein [Cytophagales bacterium]